MNETIYSDKIEALILMNLDGWCVEEETQDNNSNDDYFITDVTDVYHNKVIKRSECELFYEEALDLAYIHTNRLNIDDLSSIEANMFIRGVCKWASSNLWNKYNIRVSNENLEDTYITSYGGLLYKEALKMLNPFINQKVFGLRQENSVECNGLWR